MTQIQKNSLILQLAVRGSNFLSGNNLAKAHMCFNLIAGMVSDPRYVPSETMLNQVNLGTKTTIQS